MLLLRIHITEYRLKIVKKKGLNISEIICSYNYIYTNNKNINLIENVFRNEIYNYSKIYCLNKINQIGFLRVKGTMFLESTKLKQFTFGLSPYVL